MRRFFFFFSFLFSMGQMHAQNFNLLFSSGEILKTDSTNSVTFVKPDEISMNQYFRIIQFTKIPSEQKRSQLKTAGVELLSYIPNYAYTASVKKETELSKLTDFGIRFFSPIKKEFKLSAELASGIVPNHALVEGKISFTITYFQTCGDDEVKNSLEEKGYIVFYQNKISKCITVEKMYGDNFDLYELAALPFISYVEFKDAPPQHDNKSGRTLNRTNAIATDFSSGRHYNGSGVKVMLQDDGIIGPHIDYTGRLIKQNTSTNTGDHGDHCAGIIFGAGNKDPAGRGQAWGADLYVYTISGYQGFDSAYSHYVSPGIVISSTSYSNGCNSGYTSLAQSLDQQIRLMPSLMHVFSAGNEGDSDCGYGAGAYWGNITGGHKASKNTIAVGNLSYTDIIAYSSSRGPVKDGRLKPEVCAKGTNVYSTINPNSYEYKSGTSMSCPAVAGTLAQLYHAYKLLNAGVNPQSGLIKCILMNSCDDLGNTGPDFIYGYGRVNALRAAKTLESVRYLSGSVSDAATISHNITIPAGTLQARIMVYWNDYEANPSAAIKLVNDVDLKVIDPSIITHYPYVLDPTPLITSLSSPAVYGRDSLNNHEQVVIDNPLAGTYTIQIDGTTIPQGPQSYFISYEIFTDEITVTYPIGGEAFSNGTETIRWDAYDTTTDFLLEYSTDGGTIWDTIGIALASKRYYNWIVPTVVSGQCLIRITRDVVSDQNDAFFSIIHVPTNIEISTCPDTSKITWSAVTGATGYDIFMLADKYMDSVGTTNNTWFDLALPYQTQTWVSVRARGPLSAVGTRAVAIQTNGFLIDCEPYSGVPENPNNFLIFPNPAHDVLNIVNNKNMYVTVPYFTDILGKIPVQLIYDEKLMRIDVSHLAAGVYILHFNESDVYKVVIQK